MHLEKIQSILKKHSMRNQSVLTSFIPVWGTQTPFPSASCFGILVAVDVAALEDGHFPAESFDYCGDHFSGSTDSSELERSPQASLCCCNSPHHTDHLCLPANNDKPHHLFSSWLQQVSHIRSQGLDPMIPGS